MIVLAYLLDVIEQEIKFQLNKQKEFFLGSNILFFKLIVWSLNVNSFEVEMLSISIVLDRIGFDRLLHFIQSM